MYKIGISGEPGAGKTTISESILDGENKRVIHLDKVFDSIKRRLNRFEVIEKNNGEVGLTLKKESQVYKLLHSNTVGRISYSLADLYGSLWLISQIKKALEDNVEYLIIEGCYLESYINLQCLDYTIYIDTRQSVREKRIIERENTLEAAKCVSEIPREGYDLIACNNASTPYDIVDYLNEQIVTNYLSNNVSDKPLVHSLMPNKRKYLHL